MRVDHIGLSVADLEAQRDWYCAAFGLEAVSPFTIGPLGLRGVFVKSVDGVALELLERDGSTHPRPAEAVPESLLTQGFAHLCFRVEDVDAALERAVAAGGTVVGTPGPSPEPGVRFAFVRDPEGNFVELLDRDREVGP